MQPGAIAVIGICILIFYAVIEAIWFRFTLSAYRSFFAKFSGDGKLIVRSMTAALLAYIAVAVGAAYFVIIPSCRTNNLSATITRGVVFGAVLYGVYNLTNKATLPGYPWAMVAMDTLWGAVAMAAVSVVAHELCRKLV
jgi:uncharacterized membrane protein